MGLRQELDLGIRFKDLERARHWIQHVRVRHVFKVKAGPVARGKTGKRNETGGQRLVELYGEGGEVVRVLGVNIDITDRKRLSEALHESEQRYRAIVEEQVELICRWRPDGTVVFVNQAFCRFRGEPADQLLGTRFLPATNEKEYAYPGQDQERNHPEQRHAEDRPGCTHARTFTCGECTYANEQ